MSIAELAAFLGIIAGVLVSIGIIWAKGVRPLIHFLQRVSVIHDTIEELPEWCKKVDVSLEQLSPNGGQSMKDKVDETHRLLRQHIEDERVHNIENQYHFDDTNNHS